MLKLPHPWNDVKVSLMCRGVASQICVKIAPKAIAAPHQSDWWWWSRNYKLFKIKIKTFRQNDLEKLMIFENFVTEESEQKWYPYKSRQHKIHKPQILVKAKLTGSLGFSLPRFLI